MTTDLTNGTTTVLDEEAVQAFATRLRGTLLEPDSDGYEPARRVWNGLIDKHPAMIARCVGTGDIVDSINFARDRGLAVAVRGGGHNVAGTAVCDDGLVIDLSQMRAIHVDPVRLMARVQPGARWGDVDRETQLHGLATPGGQAAPTGVAGFTLGGGMGFLRRKWGLACDNLLSVEIVTADGRVMTASETENPDLFWAVRGGGGNFGVISSFEFRLFPLGPEVFSVVTVYPFEEAAAVLRAWRDFALAAPDEVTCDAIVWGMPPFPDVPPEMHWAPVVILAGLYAGPAEEGERLLQPVREMGSPIGDMSGRQSYVATQSNLDALFPDGQHYYWKSLSVSHLSDEVIDELIASAADKPSPQTMFALRSLGGAMGRVPEDATAYANRDALFNISVDNVWQDSSRDEEMISWTRSTWASLRELTDGGVYLNFAGFGEEYDTLARAAYGINFDRLTAVKHRYDPTNFFRGNINIAP